MKPAHLHLISIFFLLSLAHLSLADSALKQNFKLSKDSLKFKEENLRSLYSKVDHLGKTNQFTYNYLGP
jgi:hypothetical protein